MRLKSKSVPQRRSQPAHAARLSTSRTSGPPLVAFVPKIVGAVDPALRALFHHFFRWRDPPVVRGVGILRPDLRSLRPVAMPGPRLEVAEFLVHAVQLGEQLGDQSVRAAMVAKQVVADAVPPGPPEQLV